MGLIFLVIFSSVFISSLNGQQMFKWNRFKRLNDYNVYQFANRVNRPYRPVLQPILNDWNNIEEEVNDEWAEIERRHMNDNSIDGSNYLNGYNDNPSVRYVTLSDFIRANPHRVQLPGQLPMPKPMRELEPEQRSLSDPYNRYDNINEIIGSRFADNSGYKLRQNLSPPSGRAVNGLTALTALRALNAYPKPHSRANVNLIPPELIASKPFRIETLGSIGYGSNFRFY